MKTYEVKSNLQTGLENQHAIYNGLDCMVTYEVFEKMHQLDACEQHTYDLLRALRGPAMAMTMRGIRVDEKELELLKERLKTEVALVRTLWDKITVVFTKEPINTRSPQQLNKLFYETLGMEKQMEKGKVTTGRTARNNLSKKYPGYVFIFNAINFINEHEKLIGTLKPTDGRIHASFNITGAETGRWSSSKSLVHGSGTNLQNITDSLRKVFIPDPGKMFVYIDLEQAESRVSGLAAYRCTGIDTYLRACESGDLHSMVSEMVWAGKDPQEIFYRNFTRRDIAKRLGHGSNYNGRPWTMARHTQIPVAQVKDFQHAYFEAFPELKAWHAECQRSLTAGSMITCYGTRRRFYGDPKDNHCLNEAIAADPQNSVVSVTLDGLVNVWREIPEAEPLVQLHDGNLFQIPVDRVDLIPRIKKLHEIPMTVPTPYDSYNVETKSIIIPVEVKTGFYWKNSELKKYVA